MPANKSKVLLIPEEKIPLLRVARSLNAQVKIIKGLGKFVLFTMKRHRFKPGGTVASKLRLY